MYGLKNFDIHIKVATTAASYTQFMAGDTKNYPISRLNKMTELQKQTKAKQYAKQVADLCLKYGYKYSPRLHVDLFGNKWGT